ncbi:MAG: GFA family protein [Paracoccaceae bacterium]
MRVGHRVQPRFFWRGRLIDHLAEPSMREIFRHIRPITCPARRRNRMMQATEPLHDMKPHDSAHTVREDAMDGQTTTGRCYCGSSAIALIGPPRFSGLCHCQSCRRWHAAPLTSWCTWQSEHVTLKGDITRFSNNPESTRISCARCGGGLGNQKPRFDVTVIYANTLDQFAFRPTLHVFYAERVMDIADGLLKYADLPVAMGGTGALCEQPSANRIL